MRISMIDTARCAGGEGPIWDAQRQNLLFIDNVGCKAHRYTPATGVTETWETPNPITTLCLRWGNGAVVTLRDGIYFLSFSSGDLTQIRANPEPRPYGYNDGIVDRRGRFVIGGSTTNRSSPGPDGGLFVLEPDLTFRQLDDGVHYSNGPCFSPDGATLYFADSWLRTIYAYDYDVDAGAVSNKRVFVTTEELGGLPDGAAVDRDGQLWVAIYGGSKIACFNPDGSLNRTLPMPVKLVSSVAFGGEALDRLFVTTISHGMDGAPTESDAGAVYVVDDLGTAGIAENRFAG